MPPDCVVVMFHVVACTASGHRDRMLPQAPCYCSSPCSVYMNQGHTRRRVKDLLWKWVRGRGSSRDWLKSCQQSSEYFTNILYIFINKYLIEVCCYVYTYSFLCTMYPYSQYIMNCKRELDGARKQRNAWFKSQKGRKGRWQRVTLHTRLLYPITTVSH